MAEEGKVDLVKVVAKHINETRYRRMQGFLKGGKGPSPSQEEEAAEIIALVERTIANEALRQAAEVAREFWRVGKPEGVSFYDCIADRIEALIKEPGHE